MKTFSGNIIKQIDKLDALGFNLRGSYYEEGSTFIILEVKNTTDQLTSTLNKLVVASVINNSTKGTE